MCKWLGNTTQIASKHYLQVTEEHFEKAVHFPVQYVAAEPRNGSQDDGTETTRAGVCGAMQNDATSCKHEPVGAGVGDVPKNDATPCFCRGLHRIPPRGVEPLSPG